MLSIHGYLLDVNIYPLKNRIAFVVLFSEKILFGVGFTVDHALMAIFYTHFLVAAIVAAIELIAWRLHSMHELLRTAAFWLCVNEH